MNFAPFSFLNAGAASVAFNPNDISDLTFWVDFSNTNFYSLSGTNITQITSSVNNTPSHILNPFGQSGSASTFFSLTSSLSQPSLNSARVTVRPTSYYATNWNADSASAIVQGPKTATTSYPDGMTFMVLNREYNDNLGYYIARFDGTTDRGAFFSENRTGGSYPPKTPQLTIGTYDQNSGIMYFSGSNNTANVILTRENNSATRTIWRNSTQVGSDSGNNTQTTRMRQFNGLGKYFQGSQTTNPDENPPVNTYYCEVIQYNRVLSSTERTQVWNYLSNKWNISL